MNWVKGTCKGYINPSLKPLYQEKRNKQRGRQGSFFPSDNPLINLTLHAKSPQLKGNSVIET